MYKVAGFFLGSAVASAAILSFIQLSGPDPDLTEGAAVSEQLEAVAHKSEKFIPLIQSAIADVRK